MKQKVLKQAKSNVTWNLVEKKEVFILLDANVSIVLPVISEILLDSNLDFIF